MNFVKHLRGFFFRLSRDKNMTAHHISLYLALFQLWNANRFRDLFEINRMDLMSLSRIGSRNTYSKCIRDLHKWGYIRYFPGANRFHASRVSCIRFDTAQCPTIETASDTASETASGTASGTTYINYINNKKGKQHPEKNKNGMEKRSGGRFHVDNDKNYAEPL